MLGVIEYGAGNIRSVLNALDFLGIESLVINNCEDFDKASHLILPGVGAFGHGMHELQRLGFVNKILDHVNNKKPLLGICLGMQLLFEKSYEQGEFEGLGILKGEVLPFSKVIDDLRVPHVGWNECKQSKDSHFNVNESYYFTHSYYCAPSNQEDILSSTEYGVEFTSSVLSDNVLGFQFHPEKSHHDGLMLLKKFLEM
ncbi:Imidazole glycerol phosphate synthase subunit hisH [Halobacteriovorax marinus SJ]|uniref:Imidazole glycerol phosphate synthase subunit HisH n=1 Tax=Halobacteriovorax marinus (strain ATCC BAA-682 / DSM 15412 / SJ) TaxID=862908 RepID=E1X3U0_HALMS|nr:imidazole glycerol phosphate synthase subunit HisH [Halobacteriovorax marinus]CBW25280.1 Imidazole glycerol phosphate synthase subunit hisH [Halobacteriovorax marinus SJ]